jgi:tyrosyl-tRNA synthetase
MGPDDLPALLAGPADVVPADGLREKLELGRPLRVKLGVDPTAPAVTLGWAVVLRKLRQFQDAGHTVVLILGDFTARVGDPSGKSETRPRLSKEQVDGYADTLLDQFWLILDRDRTELRRNAEWLEPLDIERVLRLTAAYTVARMLERDDFADRHAQERPISIMEFLYPLLQGYDSVAVEADIELGGNDQLFNLLVGRDLQREFGQEPQVALTVPLLVGTDGVQKMSQSLGNYVAITDAPGDMFGKLLRVPDELIPTYRRLTLDFFGTRDEWARVEAALADGTTDPWAEKRRMAREIVTLYHGADSARAAEERFDAVFRRGEVPDDGAPFELPMDDPVHLPALLVAAGLTASTTAARRDIDAGAVRVDGVALPPKEYDVRRSTLAGRTVAVGKRRLVRLIEPG